MFGGSEEILFGAKTIPPWLKWIVRCIIILMNLFDQICIFFGIKLCRITRNGFLESLSKECLRETKGSVLFI